MPFIFMLMQADCFCIRSKIIPRWAFVIGFIIFALFEL
jgi:hypothetical protein